MIKEMLDKIPNESWFYEAEKRVKDVYINSLTCETKAKDSDDISTYESVKCTYCEGADLCYGDSLSFNDLIKDEHIKILKDADEQQVFDIIFDLKRTTFHCIECMNEEQEDKDLCHNCEGIVFNGFHHFLSKIKNLNENELIEKFIQLEEKFNDNSL